MCMREKCSTTLPLPAANTLLPSNGRESLMVVRATAGPEQFHRLGTSLHYESAPDRGTAALCRLQLAAEDYARVWLCI
jgi:hypothetical protein